MRSCVRILRLNIRTMGMDCGRCVRDESLFVLIRL